MKTKHLFLLFITQLFIYCSDNSSPQNQTPTVLKQETFLNVSYGSDPLQKIDVYLPANRTNQTKTLFLVHGGGWTAGDKNDMNYLVPFIKENLPNYAIVNVNYRLANATRKAFPMELDDIASALSFVKAQNYTISNTFGFIGVSAGAHLSLLHTYTKNSNNEIKMVASIIGPTNFRDINYTNNPAWISQYFDLTGVNYVGNESYYENISPVYKVTASSAPTLMLYGNADSLIPNTQHEALQTKLNQFGVYNELLVSNGGHGDWAAADQLIAYTKLIDFIKAKF